MKYDNCPDCNKKILLNEEKCPKCGLLIAKESCPACGTQVFLNNKECNSCGLKLRDS
ncbi:double zinc ribbon domain-containing protein [Chengkuizengella sp. SCS-71B]|uniref:double zinc ribbon domain-containing protein n=1 Tax=Chengkuizengella sp. SCS-71B TaxID=3115290 RepID=UPI0039B73014